MTKRILADYRGHEVEITNLVSDNGHKLVSVEAVDGSKPFYKFYYGAGGDYENSTVVNYNHLTDVRIEMTNQAIERADKLIADLHAMLEDDPFQPDDTQPEPDEPEYDEYTEWMQMTSELRRGEG